MNKFAFAQLVDIEQTQHILESHYKITGVLSAILDNDEKILAAAGWQDICTRFHRAHPDVCKRCMESDAYIKKHLPDFKGEYLDYRCKNGLRDVAVPIIIAGEHMATFFTGQFFYDDDHPDVEYFRAQAREFGFDEESYLEALGRVPVFTRKQIRDIMDYYRNLVQILVEMGLKNLELAQEINERKKAERALQGSRDYLDKIINSIGDPVFVKDRQHRFVLVNDAICALAGGRREDLIGRTDYDFFPKDQGDSIWEKDEIVFETERENINKEEITNAQGNTLSIATKKSLYKDQDGNDYIVGIIHDISDLKRTEEELRTLNAELEDRVAVRTDELAASNVDLVREITEHKLTEDALRRSNQRLDLLTETANWLLKSGSPQKAVDSLCRKVQAFLDCDAFFNYLVDEEKQRLHLNACGGIPEEEVRKMEWLDCRVGLCGCLAHDGFRLVIDNVQETLDQYTTLVRQFGIRAYACHPLISQGNVLGTLSFCSHTRTHFTDEELSLMKAVADQVAIAMERKRVEEDMQRAYDELEKRVAERTDQLTKTIDILQEEIAERQKTEEALRKSEERYSLAVDGVNDGIWDRDISTGKVYYSPRWKSMLGHEDHEISNNSDEWRKRIHPDDYRIVMNALEGYLEGIFPSYEVEYRLQHKDGSYRWIHARGACLRDRQGKPFRIAGSHTDITSRKIADEIHRQNEALFRTVLETLPVGVWILEKDGRIALSNEAARKIWAGAQYVGINHYDMHKGWWHHTGKQIEKEEWAAVRAINKGETSLGEIIDIECLDGSRKTMVNSAVPLRNDKGEIFAAVVVNEDITELKITEKSLMESEKKYRTLFEESKDTIFVSDKAGRLIDINQAGVELFGYTKEELLSMDMEKLYCNPEDRKRLWQKLLASGFVNDYEMEMKRNDDEKIIVHFSGSVIKDDAGQIYGFRGISRNVTERKKLEQQLLQAQKMESIGLLAGGVAHDFNNLLTAISGYGQILQDNIPMDAELLQESIDQVLKASERAAELTRSLLAFSRKQIINPKPVHVDTLISNTSKLIQRIIGEDIEFSTAFSDKKLLIMADAGQIEQVLMNLATNARDAMPHGGSLSISTRQVVIKEGAEALYNLSLPGKYALISVTDSGAGINEKSMEKLFEPFFTTKEIGKGTGLGLSIVYGIIKQHEGSVLVSSEPNKGTTFNIYLPLVEGRVVKEDPYLAVSCAGGMETILVAEDEEIVKVYLQRILERAGYRVIVADNGEEAVAKFEEHGDISLVLSDVVMPKKNGKEILEDIKKIKPEMKVVFISGYTADIMHSKGILENDVDFIKKPFLKADLLRKVREVLDRR
jgi:PAS domain S-box-containing protein